MTKSELAAQKCADMVNDISKTPLAQARDYLCGPNGFRRFVEHVSDLCEQAIASGDTSGLEELVLREQVDPAEEDWKEWSEAYWGQFDPETTSMRFTVNEMRKAFMAGRGKELGRQEAEQRGEGK